ncbi:MAG: hypothetical protein JWR80_453 [Bradyrhizobium sp.]|nr:hypothetical protein [Bradyrhizobium sp.]
MLHGCPWRFAIGALFEAIFTAVGLIFELVLGFIAWLFRPMIRAIRDSLGADRPKPAPTTIKRRELPQGATDGILAALQADKEAAAALPPGWRGFYAAITSETERIGDLQVGTEVRSSSSLTTKTAKMRSASRSIYPTGPQYKSAICGEATSWAKASPMAGYEPVATRRRTLRAEAWEAVIFTTVYDP